MEGGCHKVLYLIKIRSMDNSAKNEEVFKVHTIS